MTLNLSLLNPGGDNEGQGGLEFECSGTQQVKRGYSWSRFNSSSAAASTLPCCKSETILGSPSAAFTMWSLFSSVTWAQGHSKGKPQMQKAGSHTTEDLRIILNKQTKPTTTKKKEKFKTKTSPYPLSSARWNKEVYPPSSGTWTFQDDEVHT